MVERGIVLRAAVRADADRLAGLADMASGGLLTCVWAAMGAEGESPVEVGARRIADEEGTLGWRGSVLATLDGAIAGGMITSRIGWVPEPLDPLPAMLRPMQALKNRAPGAYYINCLAVLPAFRRRGVAGALLGEAERRAAGAAGLCLVVADRNLAARRLYATRGFAAVAEEPMVKDGWASESDAWVLMVKPAG
jgi:ribosomal protein S18 acetylase RimI-like enzyme